MPVDWTEFEAAEPQATDWSEFEPVEEKPSPTAPVGGALGTRFRPTKVGVATQWPTWETRDQSLAGISPELIPSGANTRAPWLTIPASVAGKTLAGVGGYMTSPQGLTETALAATPAAPVVFAKWAYDMAKGGYKSTKAIVEELGVMAREAFDKGIISANQLGPVPEGVTTQQHIQNLAENAANAAVMGMGALGAGAHAAGLAKGLIPDKPISETKLPEVTAPKPTEEAPPTAITGEAPPTAPATVAAKEGVVTAAPSEPAIAEPNATAPVTQVAEPSGAQPIVGMGGAEASEIPVTGAGGEKYGVAQRVREERAQAGQVEPVQPGTGTSPEAQVMRYREVVREDPTLAPKMLKSFEEDPRKQISAELEGVTRAHGEALFAGARTIEEQFGTESPEYKAAYKVASDWDRRTKPIQTEWSEIGRGQQGETDIDTGSFTGLLREREKSGKGFTEQQKGKAKKIAGENKAAEEELGKASEALKTRIRQKPVNDAEKAAIDAANRTVREADVRMADAVNKQRVADEKLKQATERVQKDAEQAAIDAANKTVRNNAARIAEAENKARVVEAARQKKIADAELKAAQKKKAAADREVRNAAAKAAKEERRRLADPAISVWETANKYLEENKGFYSFDDLRNKVATDLKMPVGRVTRLMARDAKTKRLAVDLWNKQRDARRLKESAKRWLKGIDTPAYQKWLASVPRTMFAVSVGGHGFVALGTHAPAVAFQPRFWKAYAHDFGRMYKMVFNPAYYESQMQDLVRSPNYQLARHAGLQNDPFKYEEYNTRTMEGISNNLFGEKFTGKAHKFLTAGNRGYAILKVLRQDMFDQMWNKLPRSIQVQEGVASGIADIVNHATGVTKKGAHPAFAVGLFAPRLAASRFMWGPGDAARASAAVLNWKNVSEGERQFAINYAKEKAWVFGTFVSLLAANQGLLSAFGSDQKINGIPEEMGGAGFDPLASDFLKFKAHGANIAYGGALLTLAKLPLRMGEAVMYEGRGSKYVLEDERLDKVLGQYVRSQMSPFAGTVTDLTLGRDYQERPLPRKMFGLVEQTGQVPKRLRQEGVEPYGWGEYALTHAPIPLAEGIKEVYRGMGMTEDQAQYWLKALGIVSFMTGTGTRITEDTREE